MSTEVFNLDRHTNVKNNVDALGKRWHIKAKRGGGLVYAEPEPYRSDFICPTNMSGLWTTHWRLQDEINKHLKDSWDHAEAAQAQAARTKQAAKENKKKGLFSKEA